MALKQCWKLSNSFDF